MSKAHILVKNTFWVYLSKFVTQLFQAIVTIFIIRKLSVDDFGSFNFLVANVALFSLCGTSAMCVVFNRYIPELYERKAKLELLTLVRFGILISVALASFFSIVFYVFREPLSSVLNMSAISNYAAMFMAFLLFSLVGTVITTVLSSLLLHKVMAHVRIVSSIIRTLAYLVALPWLCLEIMFLIEIANVALILVANLMVYWWFKCTVVDKWSSKGTIRFEWRRAFRLGLYSSLNEIGSGLVGKMSDYYIIAAMSNVYYTGIYSFGYRLFAMTQQALPMKEFLTVLRPVFFQKFSVEHKQSDYVQTFNFIVKFMLLVNVLPVLYVWLFGRPVINLVFSPKYADAYLVTCVIMFSNVITAVFYPLGLVVLLHEKMEYALFSKIVVIFSIIAGIFAMKYYGILGVAMVTTIGEIAKNVFMCYLMNRYTRRSSYRFSDYRCLLLNYGILFCLFFYPAQWIGNIYALVAASVAYVVCYMVVMFFFNPFSDDDLQMLEKIAEANNFIKKIKPSITKLYNWKEGLIKVF